MHPDDRLDLEASFGPRRLWDARVATGEVCCAAFQLGACVHTESYDLDDACWYGVDDDFDAADAEQAHWEQDDAYWATYTPLPADFMEREPF